MTRLEDKLDEKFRKFSFIGIPIFYLGIIFIILSFYTHYIDDFILSIVSGIILAVLGFFLIIFGLFPERFLKIEQVKEKSVFKEKVNHLVFKRGITTEEDPEIYRKIFLRGFIAALIYSLLYGIYEYFIVYNQYIGLVHIYGDKLNWLIMYSACVLTVAIATRYDGKFNIELMIMGLFFMVMLEDVIFWLCQWAHTGVFPFPAGNWWDSTIASYRVLGGFFGWVGLGWAVPFWPYFPVYYIIGFPIVIGYYFICLKGPKASRTYAWIVGPIFIAIIAGALSTDLFALISLILIPIISYIYILSILYIEKRGN